jgi:heat shock protein HslJ
MRFIALLVLVASVAVAGCGGDDASPGQTTGAASAADLDGRTFVATSVSGRELVPGTTLTMRFDGGTLGVTAGCNMISGGYAVDDGVLRWTAEPAQTLIGCESALQRQDEWLARLLTDGVEVAASGWELRLSGGDVVLTLSEGTAPGASDPPPIAGTTWTLETISGRGGTSSNVPAGVRAPTLRIGEDGTAEVFAGCNRGVARARLRDDGFVVFGPLALTKKACDEAAMRVERAVAAVLRGRVALAFEEGGRLSAAKDGNRLTFRAG